MAEITEQVKTQSVGELVNRRNLTDREKVLLTGVLGEPKLLGRNFKSAQLVDVEDGRAILKQRAEYPRINCECGAFVVSDGLGFDFVPATVIREIDGKQASLQEFIPGTSLITEVDEAEFQDDLYKLWIFDHIIRGFDRHEFNVLFKDSRLIAIDHEASFLSLREENFYDQFKTFYGKLCPKGVAQIFERYFDNPGIEQRLREDLAGLLAFSDIEETVDRINHIGRLILDKGQIVDVKAWVPHNTK